jgi:hypothetical protein
LVFLILQIKMGIGGIVFVLFGFEVPMLAFIPIGLFEITIGFWLLLKGDVAHG